MEASCPITLQIHSLPLHFTIGTCHSVWPSWR